MPDAPPPPPATTEVIEPDPKKPWKAVVAFAVPIAVALVTSLLPGSDGGSTITSNEWLTILAAGGLTGAGVYVKKNPLRSRRLP